jgi:hypothetical protein
MKHQAVTAIALVGTALIAALVPVSAGAARHQTSHFTDTSVGASIGGNRAVAVTHDPEAGQGASVETLKVNGLSGTGRIITYWIGGTTTDVVTFTLKPPDATGISTVTGHGHRVAATGKFKSSKVVTTFSGTYDIKTTISHLTIRGTVE